MKKIYNFKIEPKQLLKNLSVALTDKQIAKLREISETGDVSIGHVIRSLIDYHLMDK